MKQETKDTSGWAAAPDDFMAKGPGDTWQVDTTQYRAVVMVEICLSTGVGGWDAQTASRVAQIVREIPSRPAACVLRHAQRDDPGARGGKPDQLRRAALAI